MMNWRRILVILGALITLIVAALLLSARFLPQTELIRRSVQNELRELTGREITIDSIKFTGSFPDLITLDLQGIALVSHDGRKVASVDRLILSPSLLALLRREISIKSATINGLRATLERSTDGKLNHPFQTEVAVSRLPEPMADTKPRAPTKAPDPIDSSEKAATAPVPTENGLKWSVKSVKLQDGRIDWVDRQVAEGHGLTVSLTSISGRLTQQQPGDPIAIRITSRLSNNTTSGTSPVNIEGQILPTADLASVERIAVSVAVQSLPPDVLRHYFPAWCPVSIRQMTFQGQAGWEKGRPSVFSLTTEIKDDSGRPAKLDFQGEFVTAEDLSDIRQIRFMGETEALPLEFLTSSLPTDLPFDSKKAVFKTKVNGEWSRERQWRLGGTGALENVIPTGVLSGLPGPVRVDAEFQMDPGTLYLEKAEIRESERLVSVSGRIEKLFSDERMLNLSGNAIIQPQRLSNFGVHLPKTVNIKGGIPVQVHVRGRAVEPLLDLTGDMTNAAVRWVPHLEKPSGNRADVSLKGKIFSVKNQKPSGLRFDGRTQLRIAGARVRMSDHTPWLDKSFINLDSKALFNGRSVDLKDAALVLKGGPVSREVLNATANIAGLGSAHPKFEGSGAVVLDPEALALFGLELPSSVVLKGSSRLKAGFMGDANELNWTLDLPLTNLDIAVDRSFRKATGIPGGFKASGKWSMDALVLSNGQLTLPGLAMTMDGKLRDATGKFQNMNVELKKADARDIARFVPAVGSLKLSGPVEASIRLRPGDKGVTAGSSVHLLAMDCRPDKAAWYLEKLQGRIETDGANLVAHEITGRLQGTMEGPLKIKTELNNFSSLETMLGRLSLHVGPGRFNAERLRNVLNPVRVLIGTLLDPDVQNRKTDLMEFESLGGDFDIKAGTAYTDNFRLKGHEYSSGAVGSLRLDTLALDAIAGIHTVTVAGDALGKIPEVQKFVKKHEDLLKITGLDKELQRIGIQAPSDQQVKPDTQGAVKTPVTVIVKLKGTASSPEVTPILETSVDKQILARLKSLLH